ncbi:MAG: hypothetical protein WDW36_006744 [Sanguina aurantia]
MSFFETSTIIRDLLQSTRPVKASDRAGVRGEVEPETVRPPGFAARVVSFVTDATRPIRTFCSTRRHKTRRSSPLHSSREEGSASLASQSTSSGSTLTSEPASTFPSSSVPPSTSSRGQGSLEPEPAAGAGQVRPNAPPGFKAVPGCGCLLVSADPRSSPAGAQTGAGCDCSPDIPEAAVSTPIAAPKDDPVLEYCYTQSHAVLGPRLPSTLVATLLDRSPLDVSTGRAFLGAGGFAMVYRLHMPRYGGGVAVKSARLADMSAIGRFVEEASHLAESSFAAAGKEGGLFGHLVMELAVGTLEAELDVFKAKADLNSERCRDSGMSARHCDLEDLSLQLSGAICFTELVLEVCQQLACCEERRVLHADVKAGNVLLTRNSATGRLSANLADWGISQRLPAGRDTVKITVGTTCCQAPESLPCYCAITGQDIGSEAGFASDVYSFGAMCARVFLQVSDVIAVLCPEVPAAIVQSLSTDPAQRPSAARFVSLLQGCLPVLRAAKADELEAVPFVQDSLANGRVPGSVALMRHAYAFVMLRQALAGEVMEHDFAVNADIAAMWLACDAIGAVDQLGEFVWSVVCRRFGVSRATVRLEGWDEGLELQGRVMGALRERMLREGMQPAWSLQQAKDEYPGDFDAAYGEMLAEALRQPAEVV